MAVTTPHNIYLVGPRASGKTSLGRLLAERLERPFLDLDEVFRESRGESIAALVAREGWERFREIERDILAETAATPGRVVATGGGAVLLPENRKVLARGVVVYLQADPERLAERLLADFKPDQRPNLTGLELAEEIKATLAEREPLYLGAAHVILPEAPLELLVDRAEKALSML
ncbi:shikimate kinase i [hydrocarbon metagenome]|uniref:shikimate kinase n=1 Tax=hydrocarbon metagenome TaxID=938273 RepID=A0A0W8G7E0_9ZZZZ